MTSPRQEGDYLLGHSGAEHERLIRQGAKIAPITKRFLSDAGIAVGHRVLDIGSGVGDVSLLIAELVGPSGEVVGVERDASSIERAQTRAVEAGHANISFLQADLNGFYTDQRFDALVGRYVLQFLPNPANLLRSLLRMVKPGGIVAFQEPSWVPFLGLCPQLPLFTEAANFMFQTGRRAGVNTEMGMDLYRVFQEAGLLAPSMHLDVPLGAEPEFTRLAADAIASTRSKAEALGISVGHLGDPDLADRIHAEVTAANTVVPWISLVGASSRVPTG